MNPYQRAVDNELVSAHLGIANSSDSYVQAKKKLDELINWHIDVATDPAVNGGFSLTKSNQMHDEINMTAMKPFAWALKDVEASDHYGKDIYIYYGHADFASGVDPCKHFDGLIPLYASSTT